MNDRDALDMFAAAALSMLDPNFFYPDGDDGLIEDISSAPKDTYTKRAYRIAHQMMEQRKIEHDKLDRKIG